MNEKLLEALKTIKEECDKHEECEGCVLLGVICGRYDFPLEWRPDRWEEAE